MLPCLKGGETASNGGYDWQASRTRIKDQLFGVSTGPFWSKDSRCRRRADLRVPRTERTGGMTGRFLPGVPGSEIEAIFNTAAGNEIVTGKFDSPESSAALAANAFGFFLQRASDLPALPGCGSETWPALSLILEAELHFPWSGGRHPVLDCLVRTPSALIGIESKRFEPYRTRHTSPLSDAYWRRVWGEHMSGYERVRDSL